jgi:hypothetical protein
MRRSLMNSDGMIVNVVVADENWPAPDGLSFGPPGGEIGHRWRGDGYDTPPELGPSNEPEPIQMDLMGTPFLDPAIMDHVQAQQRQLEAQALAIERVQMFIDRLTAESQNITEQTLL